MPDLRYADVLLGESSLGLRTQGRGGEFILRVSRGCKQSRGPDATIYCTVHCMARSGSDTLVILLLFSSLRAPHCTVYTLSLGPWSRVASNAMETRAKKGTLRLQFHLGPFAPRTLSSTLYVHLLFVPEGDRTYSTGQSLL